MPGKNLIAVWGLAGVLGFGASVRAEAPEPLVLRPESGLGAVALQVERMLENRTGRPVVVGAPPPEGMAEAVPSGHLALSRVDGGIRLFLAADAGVNYSTEIGLVRGDAGVRALALAIESMHGARHADGDYYVRRPARESEPGPPASVRSRPRTIEPIAKPTMHLSLFAGYSPARNEPLLGPGAGLGLCVRAHCLVIEGDLSLLPERRPTNRDDVVSYRFVNMSVRFQYRPFPKGPLVPGLTTGFLTRFGRATLRETGENASVTNLGLRTAIEGAYRFAPPFEFVISAGVDYAITRSRFLAPGGEVLLEDRWTPWLVTSIRLRPST